MIPSLLLLGLGAGLVGARWWSVPFVSFGWLITVAELSSVRFQSALAILILPLVNAAVSIIVGRSVREILSRLGARSSRLEAGSWNLT